VKPPDPNDPEQQLLQLLGGKWVAAAVSAAAELGLADTLAAGALDAGQLAHRLGCEPGALLRLLRVLNGEGLLELDADGRYALTPLGATLREGQLRDLARFVGAPFMWSLWSALPHALRGGASAFERTQGAPLFAYLDDHPEEARLYHAAVDAFTRREARALADSFEFAEVDKVVDVGGGLGTLLIELGARCPALRCVLFDRENVVAQARAGEAGERLGTRLEAIAGDFFLGVPPGADAYVLKHVLHNWADEHAQQLLAHCRAGLRPGGHVLVIEGLVLPGNRRDATRLLDLEMLALCGGGRERSKPEFRALFKQAGLKLVSSTDLAGTSRLLVTAPL
jgi:precorrin-6B methylase 2/DNA-binding HxlR family transcriptional regulator